MAIKRKYNIRNIGCVVVLYLFAVNLSANNPADSVKSKTNSLFKGISLQINYEKIPDGTFTLKKDGTKYASGKTESYNKLKFNLSVPIFTYKKFRFSLSAKYTSLDNMFIADNGFAQRTDNLGLSQKHRDLFGLNLNIFGNTKLFNHNVHIMGLINAEACEFGFGRYVGIATIMYNIKENRKSAFGLGAVVLINTLSPFPIYPLISFRYTFSEKLLLNMTIPMLNLIFRYDKNNTFSLGSIIDSDNFFIKTQNENLPSLCRYSKCLFKGYVSYERRFQSSISFHIEGGCETAMSAYISGNNGHKRYITQNSDLLPYFNIGLRYTVR